MGEPFFSFFFFLFSFFFFERRSVLFIWCDKIIKDVVFKSFCWLQLSIEGISFVPGPSTLLTWNWHVCVCLCALHAACLYSTARGCVLSSYSQFLGLAQHLKTTYAQCFHFGRYSTIQSHSSVLWQRAFSAAGEFNRNKKVGRPKARGSACVCVHVC